MKSAMMAVFCITLLLFGNCYAVDNPVLLRGGDGISYSNSDRLEDLNNGLSDVQPQSSAGSMPPTFVELKDDIIVQNKAKQPANRTDRQKNKEKYLAEGRDFLAENAKKEGVVTLPSGLQYKVIKEGNGKKPGLNDTVQVYYRGTLIEGAQFGSSGDKPKKFRVNSVIRGWREALQLMREGDKWQLFIPADLAFGERGPLADRTVIYDLELISVEPSQ